MSIEPSTQLRQRTDGLHERVLGGVTVLHRSDWAKPVILNRFATLIWIGLSYGCTAEELTDELASVLTGSELNIAQSVSEGLDQLDQLDLLWKRTDAAMDGSIADQT